MENVNSIIYFLGLIAAGYIGYLVYNKYEKFKIKDFNKIALLAVITNRSEPIKSHLKRNENSNVPNINYLLSNAISITDQSIYDINKNQYENYYTQYVNEAEIIIKKILLTTEGQAIVIKEVDKYKTYLENELKEKQLIDLKLKHNRLKYLPKILEILNNEKDVSIIDFEKLFIEKFKTDNLNIRDTLIELEDKLSGLIFYSNGLAHLKVKATGWTRSELDIEIFKLSHQLSIINDSDFQRLINYKKVE